MSSVLLALGAALLSTGSVTTHAQLVEPVWEAADEIEAAVARGVAADNWGNLFVAGSMNDAAGTGHAIVQKSTTQGKTWVPSDDIAGAQFQRLTSRDNITVTAGIYYGGERGCLVRGSMDGGATWSEWGRFPDPNPKYIVLKLWDVELDGSGNIYVVAEYRETTGKGNNVTYVSRPVILKREADVWRTISVSFPVTKVVCVDGDVYCTGDPGDVFWEVRKSSDGGHTWSLPDSYRLDVNGSGKSDAADIAVDRNGNLIVVGKGTRVEVTTVRRKNTYTYYHYWIVRKGTPPPVGATAWTWTTDLFQFLPDSASTTNTPSAVAVDPKNNVHVTGRCSAPGSTGRWVTRQLTDATGTWATTDVFDLETEYYTMGNRIAADPSGNVFAIGEAFAEVSATGPAPRQWIVRRKLAPLAPPAP